MPSIVQYGILLQDESKMARKVKPVQAAMQGNYCIAQNFDGGKV